MSQHDKAEFANDMIKAWSANGDAETLDAATQFIRVLGEELVAKGYPSGDRATILANVRSIPHTSALASLNYQRYCDMRDALQLANDAMEDDLQVYRHSGQPYPHLKALDAQRAILRQGPVQSTFDKYPRNSND